MHAKKPYGAVIKSAKELELRKMMSSSIYSYGEARSDMDDMHKIHTRVCFDFVRKLNFYVCICASMLK